MLGLLATIPAFHSLRLRNLGETRFISGNYLFWIKCGQVKCMLDTMFLFTMTDKRYGIIVSVLFSFTIGLYFYFCRVGDLVCPDEDSISCHSVTIAVVVLVSGLTSGCTWRFLPVSLRVCASLVAIMPGGLCLYFLAQISAYTETVQALWHIRELTLIPLTIAECLKNETIHSAQLIRNSSLFQESHMSDVSTGIGDIAFNLNDVNGTRNQFRNAMEIGFSWLEKKGLGCRQVLTEPFQSCLLATEVAKKDCHDKGAGALCDIVDICQAICKNLMKLSGATCTDLGPEKITELLTSLRDRVGNLASGAIRMRVGILFELHATSKVEEKLASAWAPIITSLDKGTENLRLIYLIATVYVFKFVGAAMIIFWPIGYLCCYIWGPLSFDNFYITENIRNPELQDIEETEEFQVVPKLFPTLKQTAGILWTLLFSLDQFVIIAILLVDYWYTTYMGVIYANWIKLFQHYQTNPFEIAEESNLTGVEWIGQTIVQQLEKLQEALGLFRLIICIRPVPPINYSYKVFISAMIQRILYISVQTKFSFLPSFICARFYSQRHRLRMSQIRTKILMKPVSSHSKASFFKLFSSHN